MTLFCRCNCADTLRGIATALADVSKRLDANTQALSDLKKQ